MQRYIALLRGINVGGHRPLKMNELRAMFSSMNFENVTTYIQSGNVIFDGPEQDAGLLAEKIAAKIDEEFGYDLAVIVLTVEAIRKAHNHIPLEELEERDGWKGYISFLPENPSSQLKEELEKLSSDIEKFITGEGLVYSLVNKNTDEKPQFSNNFIESRMGMPATTRNLQTVRKLLDMAEG